MSNAKQRRQNKRARQEDAPVQNMATKDGFVNLTARMGLGAQNLLSEGTYLPDLLTRNRMKLEWMYRGSWIVGAAVDAVAEDMTRAGITIRGLDDPEQTHELTTQFTRMGIWHALLEGIKWGRLYGGAISVIQIDGQDPSTELDVDTISQGQFIGLRVYDRWQLVVDAQNIIAQGRHAGLPMYYTVLANVTTGERSQLTIHHSRVIRHIGIQLPAMQAITEQFWGESVIERLHDRLLAYDTSNAGAANLIQKAHLRTVQIDHLREILAAGGDAEENLLTMFHHMRLLQSNEGLTLLDKEDVFTTTQYSFSGLSDMLLQFGQQISGATGIPLVRLFGQSPAGLNSTGESDLRMYYDNINSQQESRLRDGLHKVLRIMYRSVIGSEPPEKLDFDYVALWQTSTKEKAEIANMTVSMVATAFEKGVIGQDTALQELKQSSENTGIFTNITDEQVEEAKLAPPPVLVEDPDRSINVEQLEQPGVAKPTFTDRIKGWLSAR